MLTFPDKKYNIIYADPPWQFKNYSDEWHEEHKESKWVGKQYSLMRLKEICDLPVQGISSENSVLFLWTTMPHLPEALKVIESWGFRFKSVAFTWIKKNKKADSLFWGMGFWTRSNAELCLLATKGHPKRISASVHSVIYSRVRNHSQKPDEARERIVQLLGDLPRIELFAREKAEGWDSWGLEV